MDYDRFNGITEETALLCTQSHTSINTPTKELKAMDDAFSKTLSACNKEIAKVYTIKEKLKLTRDGTDQTSS